MLFGYEFKKIWRRVSPLLVVIVLGLTTIATLVLTLIFFNQAPEIKQDNSKAEYAAMQTKIQNWNTTLNRSEFSKAFDDFYQDYKVMNASASYDEDKLVYNYNQAKASFLNFYVEYYQKYIYNSTDQNIDDYLLVESKYIDVFDEILAKLDSFFDLISPNNNTIIGGLKSTNSKWEDASLQTVLDNLFFVQRISAQDLTELQNFFTAHPANQSGYDYTIAYNYVQNRYWLAIANGSTYTGNLSQYEGFNDYVDVATSTKACELAQYQVNHNNEDFAAPLTFGNIFNNSNQVSLFDFIFTNLEMAMIPLALLVMIWAACTFFTDNYQNTLIAPVAAHKKRITIILSKTSVIITMTVLALLLLTGIYATCGLLFFHAYIGPDVLFLLNGTKAMTMSAANYFAVYFLGLVFKLLPLIAICGLFSFAKNKPFIIIGFTTLICVAVILANAFLGKFNFYQYVPLLGLDPIRYFGAELLWAPMPHSYNILYTVPAMVAITIFLYWLLIHTFRHHDF